MRATRRHAADAAAADLTTAYERWSAYINPDIAAHVTAVTGWLRTIPAREAAAAQAKVPVKADDTPTAAPATPIQARNRAAKAERRPGRVSIRQRLGTDPHASYPTDKAAVAFGDAAVAAPITKKAARAAGAHTA